MIHSSSLSSFWQENSIVLLSGVNTYVCATKFVCLVGYYPSKLVNESCMVCTKASTPLNKGNFSFTIASNYI